MMVALRKESVDRNNRLPLFVHLNQKSLSARRAWIEIPWQQSSAKSTASLSARRAWIEIGVGGMLFGGNAGRSPQGERG